MGMHLSKRKKIEKYPRLSNPKSKTDLITKIQVDNFFTKFSESPRMELHFYRTKWSFWCHFVLHLCVLLRSAELMNNARWSKVCAKNDDDRSVGAFQWLQ